MADAVAQYLAVGGEIEAYWPEDDLWLAASLLAERDDGRLSIAWEEDGSVSEVPADYVRPSSRGLGKMAAQHGDHLEEESTDAGSSASDAGSSQEQAEIADTDASASTDGLDALLAAAAAAGACDEADAFVEGNRPPCALYWEEVLSAPCSPVIETAEEERKRCRPPGLMTSAQLEAFASTLGSKRARRHL